MPKLSELITQPGQRVKLSQVTGEATPSREERMRQAVEEARRSNNPTRDMGTGERIAAGFGKAFVDTGRGVKQFAIERVRDIARGDVFGLMPGSLLPSNAVTRWADRSLADQQRVIDEGRRIDEALMDTGAGLTGNMLGHVAQIIGPGAALRGTAAGRAVLPTTIRGNALQGGVVGSLQPTATGESRGTNAAVGAAFGGGGAAAAKAAGAGYRAAKAAVAPVLSSAERNAATILLREARDAAALMRPQPSALAGVRRTLGEESMDPGILAVEQAVRGAQRGVFEPIDLANNAARVDALGQIAGTPAQRAAAESARDATTTALREQSFQEGDEAIALAARSGIGFRGNVDALRAQIDGMAEGYAGRPTVRSALADVSRALEGTSADVRGLYQVRQYIGDLLSGKAGADKGYAQAASRELIQMRELIDQEIAQVSPTFGQYLQSFKQMSRPLNRMDIGEELLSPKAGSAVPDLAGNRQLTPAQFSRMAQDLDTVAARATGFDKAKAADILTPDDLNLITNVHDDLIRQYQRMKTVAGNSATSERNAVLGRLSGQVAGKLPFGIGSMIEAIQRNADAAVQEKLAYLIANPAEARRVLQAVTPRQRAALTQALIEAGSRAPAIAGASANATRSNSQGLDIDVVGGTPGPAPTVAELNLLRGQ